MLEIINLANNQNIIQQSENINNIPLTIVDLAQFNANIYPLILDNNLGLFVLLSNVISQNNKTELTRILDEYINNKWSN